MKFNIKSTKGLVGLPKTMSINCGNAKKLIIINNRKHILFKRSKSVIELIPTINNIAPIFVQINVSDNEFSRSLEVSEK